MSRSRGGGGRGRRGRVLQAQLTRSSLTPPSPNVSLLPLSPLAPCVLLGESFSFSLLFSSFSFSRCFFLLHTLRASPSLTLSRALCRFSFLYSFFSAQVSLFLRLRRLASSYVLLPPWTPRSPSASPQRQLRQQRLRLRQHQQQHPSKRKDFDPRFVLLAFCCNFP